jgi:hypothetical protein
MPGTELGVVPGLRRTPGVLQALPDARAVREENPIPPGAGHAAVIQAGQAGPAGRGLASLDEGSWPEGRLDPGAHGADIDPDGS